MDHNQYTMPRNQSKSVQKQPLTSHSWLSDTINEDIINISGEEKWFEKLPKYLDNEALHEYKIHDNSSILSIKKSIESKINTEIIKNRKSSIKLSSNEKWMNDVIKSGTLSDKIAALALKIQQNPLLELESLDMLLSYATKKEQRPAQLAIEALKDLFIHNLLPDRYLLSFNERPLNHPEMSIDTSILLWYEDKLLERVRLFIEALNQGMKSNIDHFKKISILVVKDLLCNKPEQENRLLTMLVNKLGDPSSKISQYCIEQLNSLIYQHPAMRGIVVREIKQFISIVNMNPKVIYIGISFLSQIPLTSSSDSKNTLPYQLVETYISLFEKVIKQNELKSKLLSALLVGINRSYPHLHDKLALMKHVDSLFRLVHDTSFTTATQALVLLSYLALPKDLKDGNSDKVNKKKSDKNKKDTQVSQETNAVETNELMNRFYRALYSTLNSDQVLSKSRNTIFLNLLYRSIKRDPCESRAVAFIKRICICCIHSSPALSAAYLLLISEVLKSKPSLIPVMFNKGGLTNTSIDHTSNKHDEHGPVIQSICNSTSNVLGTFDIAKREPSYALSGPAEFWEFSLLRQQYHPSVQAFTNFLTSNEESNHSIAYNSDPTVDFSIISFLNRFAYKNPKQKKEEHQVSSKPMLRRPVALDEMPVNSAEFLVKDQNKVDPEKKFFHKYFRDREVLRETGRIKIRNRKEDSGDQGSDSDDEEGNNDELFEYDDGGGKVKKSRKVKDFEDEIDEFADKLAEDMMKSVDNNADIDDEISDNDDDEFDDNSDFEAIEQDDEYDDDDYFQANDDMINIDGESDDNSSFGGDDLDEISDVRIDGQSDKSFRRPPHKRAVTSVDEYDDDSLDLQQHTKHQSSSVIPNKSNIKKLPQNQPKKKKQKRDSDFADATDYENEMEDILRQIKDAQAEFDSSADKSTNQKKGKRANKIK